MLPGVHRARTRRRGTGQAGADHGWLARSCEVKHAPVEGCPLRELANAKEKYPERFALAALGAAGARAEPIQLRRHATCAANWKNWSGRHRRSQSEGEPSKDVEVTAPTVLALARTGTLSEKELKTVDLILAEQDPSNGQLGSARPQRAPKRSKRSPPRANRARASSDASRLERIEPALGAAGAYLESIQEAGGGVREEQSAEPQPERKINGARRGRPGAQRPPGGGRTSRQVGLALSGDGRIRGYRKPGNGRTHTCRRRDRRVPAR